MIRIVLASTALLAAGVLAGSAGAETLRTGRSTYVHHHRHAAHHYHMTYGHHHHRSHHYGDSMLGDRSTATGGNPGGYSTRN